MAKMEMNRQEKYLNRIDKLKLMDDDFFSEALDGKYKIIPIRLINLWICAILKAT